MKKHLDQLTSSLNEIFNWHKSRVDCFANLLTNLISRQTLHLTHLATHFARDTKIESNYRRIQRANSYKAHNLHKKLTAKGMNLYKHQNLYCQSYTNSAYYTASRTINSLKTQVSGLSNKAQ